MKTKLRKIVVNNEFYVYWYQSGGEFHLFLSPESDKTNQLKIIFNYENPPEDRDYFSSFYKLSVTLAHKKIILRLSEPQFVANLITFIHASDQPFFEKGHIRMIDSQEILTAMGYSDIIPIWIKEW